jgi:glycerol-3-phosphate acyltransferase PlsY
MSFTEIMYKGFLGHYLGETGTQSGLAFLMLSALGFLVVVLASYLLGSCNFAIIISGKLFKEDIRTYGSGNAGMTNMLRTYGKKAAALTLFADALKAVVSILIGRLIWGIVGAYVAGVACMIGHVFPVFYKFRGGKGVVVAAVTILMTNWRVGLILILFFVILVAGTKYISLGSVMCALIYPLLLPRLMGNAPQITVLFAFGLMLIIVLKHTSNIKRLLSGTENKISFTKKDKKSAEDK